MTRCRLLAEIELVRVQSRLHLVLRVYGDRLLPSADTCRHAPPQCQWVLHVLPRHYPGVSRRLFAVARLALDRSLGRGA